MKKLLALIAVVTLLFAGYAFARSAFEEAGDTAIESKKADQENRRSQFPGPEQPQQKREEFLKPIEENIPMPTKKIKEEEKPKLYNMLPSGLTFASNDYNCSGWMKQLDGCYERVCCCDKNGQMWCERCCLDERSGKCVVQKVRCK